MNIATTLKTTELAPAKINLFLEITGKRDDGYHQIDTVMQTVSLFDRIDLAVFPENGETNSKIELFSNLFRLPTDEQNTAYRAAQLFLQAIGRQDGISITLDKKTPSAAGLGGGSSDAAAVLRGLNRLYGSPLSPQNLSQIAAQIGADVPFFLRGGAMRCEGIGEICSVCSTMPPCSIVIAIGQQRSSTPAAYRQLDDAGYAGDRFAAPILQSLGSGKLDLICHALYNAFEGVILPQNEESRHIKELLAQLGASGALMSGSGAAVYGIFKGRRQAERANTLLRREGFRSWLTHPIACFRDQIQKD